MLKALVIKELRESAGIIALAALAAAYVVASLTALPLVPVDAVRSGGFPFVGDSFSFYLGLVLGGLAAALGLKQTAWESSHGTYHFLLHRPVSRQFVFGTKLAVGVATVLTMGGLMILVYAMWAAGTGNSATPFAWSMTASAWQLLLCLPLVYLGAFLSGLRPARWFGTRLGPLFACSIAAFVFASFAWWWLTLAVAALFAGISLSAIFDYAAKRDY